MKKTARQNPGTPARPGKPGAVGRGTVVVVDAALLPLLVGHARFRDVVLLRVLVHDLGDGRALDDAHGRDVARLRGRGSAGGGARNGRRTLRLWMRTVTYFSLAPLGVAPFAGDVGVPGSGIALGAAQSGRKRGGATPRRAGQEGLVMAAPTRADFMAL